MVDRKLRRLARERQAVTGERYVVALARVRRPEGKMEISSDRITRLARLVERSKETGEDRAEREAIFLEIRGMVDDSVLPALALLPVGESLTEKANGRTRVISTRTLPDEGGRPLVVLEEESSGGILLIRLEPGGRAPSEAPPRVEATASLAELNEEFEDIVNSSLLSADAMRRLADLLARRDRLIAKVASKKGAALATAALGPGPLGIPSAGIPAFDESAMANLRRNWEQADQRLQRDQKILLASDEGDPAEQQPEDSCSEAAHQAFLKKQEILSGRMRKKVLARQVEKFIFASLALSRDAEGLLRCGSLGSALGFSLATLLEVREALSTLLDPDAPGMSPG